MTDATTENAPFAFVRRETLEQQPAPLSVAGPWAWIRGKTSVSYSFSTASIQAAASSYMR